MNTIQQYVKSELKDCPLTETQEDKFLIALTKYLDDLESQSKKCNCKTYGHKSFIEGGFTGDKLLKK